MKVKIDGWKCDTCESVQATDEPLGVVIKAGSYASGGGGGGLKNVFICDTCCQTQTLQQITTTLWHGGP